MQALIPFLFTLQNLNEIYLPLHFLYLSLAPKPEFRSVSFFSSVHFTHKCLLLRLWVSSTNPRNCVAYVVIVST